MSSPLIVSAYPLSPAFANWDPGVEDEVLHGLAAMPGVTTLEVPWIDGIHPHDSEWFLANVPDVALALTPLPFVMRRLATPGSGPASPGDDGRAARPASRPSGCTPLRAVRRMTTRWRARSPRSPPSTGRGRGW